MMHLPYGSQYTAVRLPWLPPVQDRHPRWCHSPLPVLYASSVQTILLTHVVLIPCGYLTHWSTPVLPGSFPPGIFSVLLADMLQYMDKNVKIYHISGNIILFRNGLVNLSMYLIPRSDLVNLSIYIILRNGLVNLSINIILRNGLAKSIKSSFQTVYCCLQLVQRQL